MNLILVTLEVYTQIKALLQRPSVLFQLKIIIKSANKQGLIQSHSMQFQLLETLSDLGGS